MNLTMESQIHLNYNKMIRATSHLYKPINNLFINGNSFFCFDGSIAQVYNIFTFQKRLNHGGPNDISNSEKKIQSENRKSKKEI